MLLQPGSCLLPWSWPPPCGVKRPGMVAEILPTDLVLVAIGAVPETRSQEEATVVLHRLPPPSLRRQRTTQVRHHQGLTALSHHALLPPVPRAALGLLERPLPRNQPLRLAPKR